MSTKAGPTFQNLFLKGLADAIGHRRKAISYRVRALTLEREVDQRNGIDFERLDLELKLCIPTGAGLHFTAWEDSEAWLCIRQLQKKVGWAFKVEVRANLWNLNSEEIVRRIESTMALRPSGIRQLTPEEEENFRALWTSNLESPASKRKRKK